MPLPALAAIATKALPKLVSMAGKIGGKGGGKGGGSQAPVTSAPITSGAEKLPMPVLKDSGAPEHVEETNPVAPTKQANPTPGEEAGKKDGSKPSLGDRAGGFLETMGTQAPTITPTVMSKEAPATPDAARLTDAFGRLARERQDLSRRLMGE